MVQSLKTHNRSVLSPAFLLSWYLRCRWPTNQVRAWQPKRGSRPIAWMSGVSARMLRRNCSVEFNLNTVRTKLRNFYSLHVLVSHLLGVLLFRILLTFLSCFELFSRFFLQRFTSMVVKFLWGEGHWETMPSPIIWAGPLIQTGWPLPSYSSTVRPVGVVRLQKQCISQFQVTTKFCSAITSQYSSWD